MSIQRFTAAHELGHFSLGHQPSLDDESILRRMPIGAEIDKDFQETEADAFAIAFMMPKWLILLHCERQGWKIQDLHRPSVVYQLSLRIGASYEALCWTLARYNLITGDAAGLVLKTQPRTLKIDLLRDYQPENYRGDVWFLTERDANTRIDGSRNDLFVLELEEHSGGGYLWDLADLMASGFAIVRDVSESVDGDGIGGPVRRLVTATAASAPRGRMSLGERRPWLPAEPLTNLNLDFDLTGPEQEGLSRAARRHLFEAV
jgi:hypothetical protein